MNCCVCLSVCVFSAAYYLAGSLFWVWLLIRRAVTQFRYYRIYLSHISFLAGPESIHVPLHYYSNRPIGLSTPRLTLTNTVYWHSSIGTASSQNGRFCSMFTLGITGRPNCIWCRDVAELLSPEHCLIQIYNRQSHQVCVCLMKSIRLLFFKWKTALGRRQLWTEEKPEQESLTLRLLFCSNHTPNLFFSS